MTVSLFNNQTNETPNNDQSVSYLDRLVGPGKKFADVEALAKGKIESDEVYVPNLHRELKELRAELEARLSLEEIAEKTNPRNQSQAISNPKLPADDEQVNENEKASLSNNRLSAKELQALVKKTIEDEKSNVARSSNISFVSSELEKTWGANYGTHLNARASELGLNAKQLDELAGTSPKAFLALMSGGNVTSDGTAPPQNSSRTTMGNSSNSTIRNKAYYDNILKTDKKRYFSAELQMQRFSDARTLGDKFES